MISSRDMVCFQCRVNSVEWIKKQYQPKVCHEYFAFKSGNYLINYQSVTKVTYSLHKMKLIFHEKFLESYDRDPAAEEGRLDKAAKLLCSKYPFVEPVPASEDDILLEKYLPSWKVDIIMRCWEIILQHYWKGWKKQFEAAHLSYSDRDKHARQYLDHPDSLSCRPGITLDFAADFVLSVN